MGRVCGEILAAIDAWAETPLASAILPERDDPALRQRRVYNYRIVGHILTDSTKIVAIFHAAQDAEPILRTLGL